MAEIPLLSVCLITYNHEKYIRQALDGIFMQEIDFPMEVIIADDFSTDNTRNIILEYKEKFGEVIRLIFQEKNVGAAKNFDVLIKTPKSKYIAYLEGDDYWTDPLKLQKQVCFLEENPDFVIISGKAQILEMNQLSNIIGTAGEFTFNDFAVNNNLIACTILFRNCISYLDLKIMESVYFGDWMLYCNILNFYSTKKAIAVDEVNSVYRIHSDGVMSKLNKISSLEQHYNQIKKINYNFKVNYNLYQKDVVLKNALLLYIHYLKSKHIKKSLSVFINLHKLIGFYAPTKKMLSYYRYRNKLN